MDGNPADSEQTASGIPSYDASTTGESPQVTSDTSACMSSVSLNDISDFSKDIPQEAPTIMELILPNGRDTTLRKSTIPILSSQQVDPEILRAQVAHLQGLNDYQKKQNEALKLDLTTMVNWGLVQENKAESAKTLAGELEMDLRKMEEANDKEQTRAKVAEKRVEELEVGLKVMEDARNEANSRVKRAEKRVAELVVELNIREGAENEQMAVKEALELEKMSLAEQVSMARARIEDLKNEIARARETHNEEKEKMNDSQDEGIQILLWKFRERLGYLEEETETGTERPDTLQEWDSMRSMLNSFKDEHSKQIQQIFRLLSHGKCEKLREKEKTSRLKRDFGNANLENSNIKKDNISLERELNSVKRIKERLEAESSRQNEPFIKKEVDHWPPEKFRSPEDPTTDSHRPKRLKHIFHDTSEQSLSRGYSNPLSRPNFHAIFSSERSGSKTVSTVGSPISTHNIMCGVCLEIHPAKGWLTGCLHVICWSCFLEMEFTSSFKSEGTTSCYCGHPITYTMTLESCLADSEPPKFSSSFSSKLSEYKTLQPEDTSVFSGKVFYSLRTRQATIAFSARSSKSEIDDLEPEVTQWVARSLREWFSIPRPQFWVEYQKRNGTCLHCQIHNQYCFLLNPGKNEACVPCSKKGVPCLAIKKSVWGPLIQLLPLADTYRKGRLWKSIVSWKDPEKVQKAEWEREWENQL
ncbi:hypothetical protein BU16DRAFT_601439 [Lophium mytilinum]|uniref:RING-type domain-containing protein n=1 Tax=Lophium mytilinum TaxID=390894 RepID=A0A6A6R5V3_9PEZI|nr:hypothetical protein BU16DRAFT_601439 [Lophium mytilinum]